MSADATIASGKVKAPAWKAMVKPYQAPVNSKSAWQVINSFGPMFVLWVLMYLSLDVSYLLTLLLAFPTAGMLVRIFIIQHECRQGPARIYRQGSICFPRIATNGRLSKQGNYPGSADQPGIAGPGTPGGASDQ